MNRELAILGNSCHQLPVDELISWLATRQHGIVARWQLLELDVDSDAISYRAERGRLLQVRDGVYAVGHLALTDEARIMAAVLACGPDAVASHRTAAFIHGIFTRIPEMFSVTVAVPREKPHVREIDTHASEFHPGEVAIENAIPVTSYIRTFLDLAATVYPQTLVYAFEHLERKPDQLPELARLVERHRGERGVGKLRRVLAAHARHTGVSRSTLEREFIRWLKKRGIALPILNDKLSIGDEVFMPDCHWPAARLIIELDTWDYHGTFTARSRDSRRDRVLSVAGYTVLRVTPADLTGPAADELEAQLRALLTAPSR
jgi:very-short-patch-repair endonuclease